jgi:hypothetical protein
MANNLSNPSNCIVVWARVYCGLVSTTCVLSNRTIPSLHHMALVSPA